MANVTIPYLCIKSLYSTQQTNGPSCDVCQRESERDREVSYSLQWIAREFSFHSSVACFPHL